MGIRSEATKEKEGLSGKHQKPSLAGVPVWGRTGPGSVTGNQSQPAIDLGSGLEYDTSA